jgi:hypothetical protein
VRKVRQGTGGAKEESPEVVGDLGFLDEVLHKMRFEAIEDEFGRR